MDRLRGLAWPAKGGRHDPADALLAATRRALPMTARALLATGVIATGLLLAAVLAAPRGTPPPNAAHMPTIPGATVEKLREIGGSALVVTSLQTGGIGSEAGLRVGDRIDEIDGRPSTAATQHPVEFRVWRDGHIREIRIARKAGG